MWTIAQENGRTEALDFRVGLYQRHTVCNTVLNGFMTFFMIYGFTQSTLQRVATMPNLSRVRLVLFLNTFGITVLLGILFLTGLAVFAVYANCDPISLGLISKMDQLMPYYVMDHLGVFKGVPGLFVACLFSGTLSSISSLLSAVSAMIWIDFVSEIDYFKKASESVRTATNKLITVILGLMMITLAFLASRLGGLIQATASVFGAFSGPVMGVFVLGVMVPHCGKRGAIAGILSGIAVMVWLAIGTHLYGMKTQMLPLSTTECQSGTDDMLSTNTSVTNSNEMSDSSQSPMQFIFGISYTFFSTVGLTICLTVACLTTLVTGAENLDHVNPAHVLVCLRKWVGRSRRLAPTRRKSKDEVDSTAL